MELWMSFSITPIFHYSNIPLLAASLWQSMPRVYPVLGLFAGYVLVMLFNPVRLSLRDGFRRVVRFPRICVTFVIFGFGYSVFQFAALNPVEPPAEFDLAQITSLPRWHWPRPMDVW